MIKHLAFILLAVCITASKTLCQVKVSTPYELALVAYDTQIENGAASLLSVMTSREIETGYRIGITNSISDDNHWYTYDNSPNVTLEFVYTGTEKIKKGTVFNFILEQGSVSIISNTVDITSSFTMESKGSSAYNFLNSGSAYVTLYSGYFIPERESMLGLVLDVFPIGIPHHSLANLLLPESVANKNIVVPYIPGGSDGSIDFKDCILCEMLEAILDPSNWIIRYGDKQESFDFSVFDYIDCDKEDCEGTFVIDTINCNQLVVDSYPCEGKTFDYIIMKLVDNQFVTVATGTTDFDNLPMFPSNGTFQVIITCENGCEFTAENWVTINCLEPDCPAAVTITGECIMTATVDGCVNPIFQWYKVTSGPTNMPISGATSSTYTADDNETYYVEISGCEGCDIESSNYLTGTTCMPPCECGLTYTVEDCIISFTESDCDEVITYWQYRANGSSQWQNISNVTSPLIADEYNGNGEYRWVSHSEYCNEMVTIPLLCSDQCEPELFIYQGQDCNLVAEWSGCKWFEGFSWNYSPSCQIDDLGQVGGQIISASLGSEGSVVFSPDISGGCYVFTLNCGELCEVQPQIITDNAYCCPDSLSIINDECEISVENNPCSSIAFYTWHHGESETGGSWPGDIPPYNSDDNETIQLEVHCEDGCIYFSNVIMAECEEEEECNISISLVPDGCLLRAFVEGCTDYELIWHKKTGGIYEIITGVTGATYVTDSNGEYKVEIASCDDCNVTNIHALATTYDCVECNCTIALNNDDDCTIIIANDLDCENIVEARWFKELIQADGSVIWIEIIEAYNESSLEIEQNGNYKRVITLLDCEEAQEEAVFAVDCFEDCSDTIDLVIGPGDDCTLRASWTGCSDLVYATWRMIPSYYLSTTCEDALEDQTAGVPSTSEIETFISSDGSGYSILNTIVESCYMFKIKCGDCEVVKETASWQYCCDDACTPMIEFDDVACDINFETLEDENCHQSLIDQGYIPSYQIDTSGGFNNISTGIFYNAWYEGNYQIVYNHPHCSVITTNVVEVNNLEYCEFNGSFTYSCQEGIDTFVIAGGNPPYSFTWLETTGSYYENMTGTSVDIGFIFPEGASGDIIVTDSEGHTILIHQSIPNCDCKFELDSWGKASFKIIAYEIIQDGIVVAAGEGDWSDTQGCSATHTSTDLVNTLLSELNPLCNTLHENNIEMYIGGSIDASICVDEYCRIDQITLTVFDCTNDKIEEVIMEKNCNLDCSNPQVEIAVSDMDSKAYVLLAEASQNPDKSILDKSVTISPNPAISKTTIKLTGSSDEKYTVQLLAADGSQVFTKTDRLSKTGNRLLPIDVGQMQSGVYFLKVQIGEEYIATKKLVVVK